jgi:hypothetical protein
MMNKAEGLRQRLIEVDVRIEELEKLKRILEDEYYACEEEATYEAKV